MAKLTLEELQNLSQLLLSAEDNNVLLAIEIIKPHKEAIPMLCRELVLVWQMHDEPSIKSSIEAILKKKYEVAELKEWEKGFEIFRQVPRLYVYNPNVYRIIKNHENIRGDFQSFIEKNSHYALQYYHVGRKFQSTFKEHLDLAEAYFRIALKSNPLHEDLLFYLAFLLDKSESTYPEALQLYLKIESMKPNSSATLNNIGVIYDQQGKSELAYKYYTLAYNLSPNYALYVRNLATLCTNRLKGEDYKKQAKELLQKLVQIDAGTGTTWNSWADYLWNIEGDFDAAEKAYLKGLEVEPKNCWLLGNLGELYIDIHKEYDKGLKLYKESLEVENSPYRLVTMVTVLVTHYQNFAEAKEYYKKLVALSPPHQIIRNRYLREDQWEAFLEAEKVLKDVLMC